MSGMRQKIQYSLALEPAHQGETPVGGCQGTEPVVAKPAPQSPALASTPCRCPSLTPSNRRVRDPYARWCGRGGTARCPPIPIIGANASFSDRVSRPVDNDPASRRKRRPRRGDDEHRQIPPARRNDPWNKGRLIGQKRPLKPTDVWTIHVRLQLEGHKRDLAMFNLAIDSKLRGCDRVR